MIYLDYQATTPLAPEARDAMLRWLDGPDGTGFGNPHSAHAMGRQAAAAVELARDRVAALFPPGGRVIFTSGATEALNTVLRGSTGDVLTFAAEHAAVLDCARAAGFGTLDLFRSIDEAVKREGYAAMFRSSHPGPLGHRIAAHQQSSAHSPVDLSGAPMLPRRLEAHPFGQATGEPPITTDGHDGGDRQ